jgi:hypothetical protein
VFLWLGVRINFRNVTAWIYQKFFIDENTPLFPRAQDSKKDDDQETFDKPFIDN